MNKEQFALLQSRFPAGQFALLKEVRNAAGHHATRSADAVAMGLWPSRGLELHGIEVKSGRGDWLKELKNPNKQEDIYQYCDRFWLYATNEEVAFENEIPATWGYMLVKGKRLVVKKEAPVLKPKQLERTFLAAMIKRATTGLIDPSTIEEKIKTSYENGKQAAKTENEKEFNRLKNMEQDVNKFQESSGISIYERWGYRKHTPAELGAALKVVMEGKSDIDGYLKSLERMKSNIQMSIDSIYKKDELPVMKSV